MTLDALWFEQCKAVNHLFNMKRNENAYALLNLTFDRQQGWTLHSAIDLLCSANVSLPTRFLY